MPKMKKWDFENLQNAADKVYEILGSMEGHTNETMEAVKYMESILTILKKNELRFASSNQALQYLSDLTGKKIKVAFEYATEKDLQELEKQVDNLVSQNWPGKVKNYLNKFFEIKDSKWKAQIASSVMQAKIPVGLDYKEEDLKNHLMEVHNAYMFVQEIVDNLYNKIINSTFSMDDPDLEELKSAQRELEEKLLNAGEEIVADIGKEVKEFQSHPEVKKSAEESKTIYSSTNEALQHLANLTGKTIKIASILLPEKVEEVEGYLEDLYDEYRIILMDEENPERRIRNEKQIRQEIEKVKEKAIQLGFDRKTLSSLENEIEEEKMGELYKYASKKAAYNEEDIDALELDEQINRLRSFVLIHDLNKPDQEPYKVKSPGEAKGKTDQSAAEEAFRLRDTVTMGKVVAEYYEK